MIIYYSVGARDTQGQESGLGETHFFSSICCGARKLERIFSKLLSRHHIRETAAALHFHHRPLTPIISINVHILKVKLVANWNKYTQTNTCVARRGSIIVAEGSLLSACALTASFRIL